MAVRGALARASYARAATTGRLGPAWAAVAVSAHLVLGLTLAASGCGGASHATPTVVSAPPGAGADRGLPALSCALLVGCLPHGADEWAELDLIALRRDPTFAPLRAALRGDDAASLERTFGVPLDVLERVAIARYPRGLLAVVRGAVDPAAVVAHVGARMNTVELERELPPRRVGYLGSRRVDVFALGRREFGLAVEHAGPAERTLARAAGRPLDSIHDRLAPSERAALEGAAVGLHGRRVDFEGATSLEDSFIGRIERVTLTLRDTSGQLDTTLVLLGDLPVEASPAAESWFRGLAATEFGSLAGISASLPTLTLVPTHDPHPRTGFRLAFALPPDPVAEVLRVWRVRAVAEHPEASP